MKAAFAIAAAAASAVGVSALATPARIEARASKASSGSLPTVTVKGNAFFAGDERFYIRGIDYQPGGSSDAADGSDPLADVPSCTRDIAKFKELGINTVRVYTVDNSKNHDACMKLLDAAGIYLALDVNSPKYSLNREDPAGSYNDVYLQSVFATIDTFAGYSNTLLFYSGNEVINADNNTNCAPYIKAATRDMKQYIGSQGYRKIPVGYSAADVESNRYDLATYMNCGTDDQRSDFFAFNDYSWCDHSTFQISGWDQKVKQYSNYGIPIFLSEYGCIKNDRNFEEVSTLYSSEMTSVYSGGLVYEYSEEGSGYGLVTIGSSGVTPKPDFNFLKQQFAKAQVSGDGGYSSSGEASECPKQSSTWEVKDFLGPDLPAMPQGAVKYMGSSGAGKPPGLNGDGSQWATSGASKGTATPGSGSSGVQASGSSSATATASGAASPGFRSDASLMPYLVCGATVFFSTFLGAALL